MKFVWVCVSVSDYVKKKKKKKKVSGVSAQYVWAIWGYF